MSRQHRSRRDPRGPRPSDAQRPEAGGRRPADAPAERPRRPGAGGERQSWIYGRHAVAALLANPARNCRRLVGLAEADETLRRWIAAARARLPADAPETATREALAALLPDGAVHQGVAALADPLPEPALEDVLERAAAAAPPGRAAAVVVLDRVTDPHNVGAVLRSAAAFGALAVVLPQHGAPPVTGVLAKAASGALEHVPLVRVVNLARTLDEMKRAGFWCVALDERGERALSELDGFERVALVLGAEGEGLRRLTRERCDVLARLPTQGPVASLNVSNAAAVALYELARGGVG